MAQSFRVYRLLQLLFVAQFLLCLLNSSNGQNNTNISLYQEELKVTKNDSEVDFDIIPEDTNDTNKEWKTVGIESYQASLLSLAPRIVSVTEKNKVKFISGEIAAKEINKEFRHNGEDQKLIRSLALMNLPKESKEEKDINIKLNKELSFIGIERTQAMVRSPIPFGLLSVTKKLGRTEKKKINNRSETMVITGLKSSDCIINGNCTRRCISCSNTELNECDDPSNQVLPVEQCHHKEDSCYTKHNPFGIVTRGCYSLIHTDNYFSCACNLCNYLSIQEMPFFFSELPDWKQDVITISRIKSITGRQYHGVECLHCEVRKNGSEREMSTADIYCLEGDLEHNPYKRCEESEVCGIRVVRDSYLWRGCLRYPRYNSWWSLCDDNFCNNEPIISLDDIVIEDDIDDYS